MMKIKSISPLALSLLNLLYISGCHQEQEPRHFHVPKNSAIKSTLLTKQEIIDKITPQMPAEELIKLAQAPYIAVRARIVFILRQINSLEAANYQDTIKNLILQLHQCQKSLEGINQESLIIYDRYIEEMTNSSKTWEQNKINHEHANKFYNFILDKIDTVKARRGDSENFLNQLTEFIIKIEEFSKLYKMSPMPPRENAKYLRDDIKKELERMVDIHIAFIDDTLSDPQIECSQDISSAIFSNFSSEKIDTIKQRLGHKTQP